MNKNLNTEDLEEFILDPKDFESALNTTKLKPPLNKRMRGTPNMKTTRVDDPSTLKNQNKQRDLSGNERSSLDQIKLPQHHLPSIAANTRLGTPKKGGGMDLTELFAKLQNRPQ